MGIRYLDFPVDPSFQGVNIIFVLPFENDNGQESYTQYYLPTAEIKDYMVMIDGRNFLDQPIKSDLKTCDNISKITRRQGEDYQTGCLLDYPYFKNYYKLISTDLSKQQKLDATPKAIKQINFTGNLENNATIFFIIEEEKEAVLFFSKGILKISWSDFLLISYCCKMVKYNNSNEKFSNSQRNKLKSGIKNWNCSNFKSFIKCSWKS